MCVAEYYLEYVGMGFKIFGGSLKLLWAVSYFWKKLKVWNGHISFCHFSDWFSQIDDSLYVADHYLEQCWYGAPKKFLGGPIPTLLQVVPYFFGNITGAEWPY